MKMINYTLVILTVSIFMGCLDNPTGQIDVPDSNLYKYLENDSPDPMANLGNAVVRYLTENPEWKDGALDEKMVDGPVSIAELQFAETPEIASLKDWFDKQYGNFRIEDDTTFWNGNIKYEIEIEKYRNKIPQLSDHESLELPTYAVMFDPDQYNDEGKGIIYFLDHSSQSISNKEVELSTIHYKSDLYFVTLRDVTPEPASLPKISGETGTYLVLKKIIIKDKNESGSPEVEIFTGGNISSFYYNRVTNHRFDGTDHIDAAGDIRHYEDVNNEDQEYVMDQPIALCRLTDDFEQRLIYIEDDYKSGRFAHDKSSGYPDYVRRQTGIWSKLPNDTGWQGFTRFFRILYNNPSNNDDFGALSEIRALTISNVPSSYDWVTTTDADYYIKKVTF